ncbi:hypothetical protein BV898_08825 [Hypsibius exemplaris]|uniref:HIG1 domain-containing protein n=1 Tax=Hypsibius exemplaris TaxID=2072580 RepID=A0A1W0WPH3_HYPEX|nr:hypothetical protein BV898_08825 [Hypsibius exemplaris]
MSVQHQLTERWAKVDTMSHKNVETTSETNGELKTYDEFAHPELHQHPPPPTLTERLSRQFSEMPVFPIGMVGFLSMAGYGIYKYRKLPKRDAVSTTLYFTGLRVAAQGLAVGVIMAGAAHAVWKDYSWRRDHPGGELRPRD